jgi:hypothetical protein
MAETAIVTSVCSGICYGHIPPITMVGSVITGLTTKQITNCDASRVSDFVMGACGHIGVIISGNSTVKVGDNDQSRVGDAFSGVFTGVIISGAAKHETA